VAKDTKRKKKKRKTMLTENPTQDRMNSALDPQCPLSYSSSSGKSPEIGKKICFISNFAANTEIRLILGRL